MRRETVATGKTTDEAIDKACEELGIDRFDAEVEILQTPSKGFLGLGGSQAKVKVSFGEELTAEPVKEVKKEAKNESKKEDKVKEKSKEQKELNKKPQKVEQKPVSVEKPAKSEKPQTTQSDEKLLEQSKIKAESFLNDALLKMNITGAKIVTEFAENNCLNIDIVGDNLGAVIGKRGDTLDALQYLCSLVVNRENDIHVKVTLDTGDYRKKREKTLQNLAKSVAHKVINTKKNCALEPMQPYERRIIHATLQNYRGVTTASVGEGERRKVVVYYNGDK